MTIFCKVEKRERSLINLAAGMNAKASQPKLFRVKVFRRKGSSIST
ncbi:hypothetical protein [Nostoc sp.]